VAVTEDGVEHDERAGVEERIARDAALQLELHQRVERAARRLAADALPDPVALQPHRQREGEELGDALDGEALVRVADGERFAVDAADRHAEAIARDGGQRRYVLRHPPLSDQRADFGRDLLKDSLVLTIDHHAFDVNRSAHHSCATSSSIPRSRRMSSFMSLIRCSYVLPASATLKQPQSMALPRKRFTLMAMMKTISMKAIRSRAGRVQRPRIRAMPQSTSSHGMISAEMLTRPP